MAKKAIFIDWHKTLSNSYFWYEWQDPAHPHHHSHQGLVDMLFGKDATLFHPWMRGEITSEYIAEKLSTLISASKNHILSGLIDSAAKMQILDEQILPLVQQLRKSGNLLVIATDNIDAFSRWTVPALELDTHFDGILNSADIGFLKKDLSESGELQFFKPFLSKNKLRPNECVLIDDSVKSEPIIRSVNMSYRLVDDQHSLVDHLREILFAL